MKYNRFIIRLAMLLISTAVVFSSCSRDDNTAYDYFLNSESVGEYQEVDINGMLNVLAQSYPELSELRTFISDGVSIYRIT